jgi:hypothetical protein
MKKSSGVNYSKTVAKRSRRERVINMLEEQLKFGKKPIKNQVGDENGLTELTDKDIERIKKELSILKIRIQ